MGKQEKSKWNSSIHITRWAFLILSSLLIAASIAIGIVNWHIQEPAKCWEVLFSTFLALGLGFLPLGLREAFFAKHIEHIFDEKLQESAKEMVSKIADEVSGIMHTGVKEVFLSRDKGLKRFMRDHFRPADEHIPSDEREITIVGSSMKGLIGEADEEGNIIDKGESKRDFRDRLKKALKNGWTVKIAMTHPAFADLRSLAERRDPGDIKAEIIGTLRYLLTTFEENIVEATSKTDDEDYQNRKGVMEIVLYQGSPTMFILSTSEAMLINPYLHSTTAMENVCMEIHPVPLPGGFNLYRVIYGSHIERIWGASCTTPIRSICDLDFILKEDDGKSNLHKFLSANGLLSQSVRERQNVPSSPKKLPDELRSDPPQTEESE